MSKKVTDVIAKEIKKRVFRKADQFNYLARTRTDNGIFIDQLVTMKDVGELLSQYMPKSEIRTYIKDAILNRYSKDKTQKERPVDFVPIIQEKLALKTLFVERENKAQISLFKSPNDHCYVVVADGTYLKWETALRKALLYIASKPFSAQDDMKVYIMLTLFARHQKVSPSDLRQLQKALRPCNVIAFIYGEG